jgi:hypothetical protein
MTDIPNHILSVIFKAANFDIDTRRALNMCPQKNALLRYLSKEAQTTLSKFFETRVQQYKSPCKESGDAIVYFEKTIGSSCVSSRSDRVSINVWERPCKTRQKDKYVMRTFMSIEFNKYTHLALFSQFDSLMCDVQTGEILG